MLQLFLLSPLLYSLCFFTCSNVKARRTQEGLPTVLALTYTGITRYSVRLGNGL